MKHWLNSHSEADEPAKEVRLEDVLEKLVVYKRNTWMPVIDEDEAEQSLLASKIGGQPYIPASEPPPVCPNCRQELTLFLQLHPGDLPEQNDLDLEQDRLIQLFYCTNQQPHCELECDAYFPFAKSVVARSLPLPPSDTESVSTPVEVKRQFPEKKISDWVRYDDYPDWHEMQTGGAELKEREVEILEHSETGIPKAADKLGGWPYWVQGVEYPACPVCSIQMQMIFQIDSNHHLPYMFGDAGIAHLFQCRLHKDILAFSWAAY